MALRRQLRSHKPASRSSYSQPIRTLEAGWERNRRGGGGVGSAELTLPGFIHDVCSAVSPLAIGSPFFRTLPLREHGVEWIHPPAPFAHPLDDGTAVLLQRSVEETAS